MSKRQLLLLSSSNYHGHEYLEFAKDLITNFLKKWKHSLLLKNREIIFFISDRFRNNVDKVLFIPYASAKPNSYDEYTEKVRKVMRSWGIQISGINESPDELSAVKQAQAIFIGGGNTFLLLKTLYDKHLVDAIRARVLEGVPYIGSSAGTNVATSSIHTTNDMPIVLPPTFYALQLTPFNINPHYLDPVADGKHKGETREE